MSSLVSAMDMSGVKRQKPGVVVKHLAPFMLNFY
jgi:hypothetical protein